MYNIHEILGCSEIRPPSNHVLSHLFMLEDYFIFYLNSLRVARSPPALQATASPATELLPTRMGFLPLQFRQRF